MKIEDTYQVKFSHFEDLLLTLIILCYRLDVDGDSEDHVWSAGVRV